MHHHAPSIDSSKWHIFRYLSGHTAKDPRVVAIHKQTGEVCRIIGDEEPTPLRVRTVSVENLVYMVSFIDDQDERVILVGLSFEQRKELDRLLNKSASTRS